LAECQVPGGTIVRPRQDLCPEPTKMTRVFLAVAFLASLIMALHRPGFKAGFRNVDWRISPPE
jgi:hypothetical protein